MCRNERSIGSTCAFIDELVVEDNTKFAIQIYGRVRKAFYLISQTFPRYGRFLIFRDGDRPPA